MQFLAVLFVIERFLVSAIYYFTNTEISLIEQNSRIIQQMTIILTRGGLSTNDWSHGSSIAYNFFLAFRIYKRLLGGETRGFNASYKVLKFFKIFENIGQIHRWKVKILSNFCVFEFSPLNIDIKSTNVTQDVLWRF